MSCWKIPIYRSIQWARGNRIWRRDCLKANKGKTNYRLSWKIWKNKLIYPSAEQLLVREIMRMKS